MNLHKLWIFLNTDIQVSSSNIILIWNINNISNDQIYPWHLYENTIFKFHEFIVSTNLGNLLRIINTRLESPCQRYEKNSQRNSANRKYVRSNEHLFRKIYPLIHKSLFMKTNKISKRPNENILPYNRAKRSAHYATRIWNKEGKTSKFEPEWHATKSKNKRRTNTVI